MQQVSIKTSCDERIALRLIQRVGAGDTVYLRTVKAVYAVCTAVCQGGGAITVRYTGKNFNRKTRKWCSYPCVDVVPESQIVQLRRLI